jgi:hypothetical protein
LKRKYRLMAARLEAGRKHLDVGGLTASDKLRGSCV